MVIMVIIIIIILIQATRYYDDLEYDKIFHKWSLYMQINTTILRNTKCDHVQCRPICTELHVLSAVDRQYNARNKTEEMFKPL